MGQCRVGKVRQVGWGCTGTVKYTCVARGIIQKGILFLSRKNMVNFKNACFYYKYIIFGN